MTDAQGRGQGWQRDRMGAVAKDRYPTPRPYLLEVPRARRWGGQGPPNQRPPPHRAGVVLRPSWDPITPSGSILLLAMGLLWDTRAATPRLSPPGAGLPAGSVSEVGKGGEPRAWHALHSDHWATCGHPGTAGRAPKLPQEPAGRAGRRQGDELSPRPGAGWGRVAAQRCLIAAVSEQHKAKLHTASILSACSTLQAFSLPWVRTEPCESCFVGRASFPSPCARLRGRASAVPAPGSAAGPSAGCHVRDVSGCVRPALVYMGRRRRRERGEGGKGETLREAWEKKEKKSEKIPK